MSEFSDEVPFGETQLGYVDNFDDAQEFMRWLGQSRDILGFDTETSGLDPREPGARIRIAQFGDVNAGWTIDYQKWPGLVREVLERYEGEIALHNAKFDYSWLSVHEPGIVLPWSRTHDTMVQSRLNDNEASAALKTLGIKHFGKEAAIGQKMLEEGMSRNGWTWDTVPLDFAPYSQYAALDTVLTARMHRRFSSVHSGEFRQAYELEMQALRICMNMELRGMSVDLEYCKQKQTELDEFVEKMKAYCEAEYGVKIGSTKSLGEWFRENGAPLTEFTATGMPKMGEDELVALQAQGYELAKHALTARKAGKISGTYLENFQKFADSDGILHPQINTMAARTHRMSIQNPAMQTLPRDGGANAVRAAITAHPGEMLVSADYDQQELRMIAGLSQDAAMIAAFEQADTIGPDFFTTAAREIYKDDSITKSDPRRQITKGTFYAMSYGAGPAKIAQTAGVPLADMKEILKNIDSRYPDMARWKLQVVSDAEMMKRRGERPCVKLHDGRRLFVDRDKTYTGTNYAIQGGSASVTKQALVNLDNMGLGEYIILPIHDEVLFSIPKDLVDEVRPVIGEAMSNDDFGVAINAAADEPMERWSK